MEAKNVLDQTDLKDIIKTIAFYDKRALNIKELLIEAVEDVSPMSSEALDALQALTDWNNQNIDENGDGFCDDPGSAIFDKWWYKAVAATFEPWYPGYQNSVGQTAVDILVNRYLGYTLFYRALNGTSGHDYFDGKKEEILYGALLDALSEVNGPLPTPMYAYFPVTVLGFFLYQPITSTLEPPLPFPYVDRGTENHIVTLLPKGIFGYNITSPGNSGFIAPDGAISPHFYDQVPMFREFTYKPMLFSKGQVNSALESVKIVKWN